MNRRTPRVGNARTAPADFSHTDELMTRGYRSARRYLASVPHATAPEAQLQLSPAAIQAA